MYRYNKYIVRQLAHSTVLTALSLTGIVWLTQALRLMDFIVNQGVGIDMFLWLTLLLMPSLLLMILPIALFCACIFVYQKLKADSELVVLESAGLNHWRLVRPALLVAACVACAGYLVAFYVMPLAYTKFRDTQTYLRNNYVSVLLQEGVFNTPVDGLTVFVRERDAGGKFRGILVHDNRQPGMAVTMMAEEGKLLSTPQGQRFFLTNGNRQELRRGKLSLLNYESYTLDMSLYNKDAGQRMSDPRELFLPGLLAREGLSEAEIAKRRGELHQRVMWPASAFTLTLVGLAVLLSGEFSRRGNAWRTVLATLAVLAIVVTALSLRNLVHQHWLYLAAAYANLGAPALLAAHTLRERRARPRRHAYAEG